MMNKVTNKCECLLCKRDMNVSTTIFGKGCLRNIYSLVNLKYSRDIKNKEQYLYKHVMKLSGIKNISKEKQIWLTNRYITNMYLSKINYIDNTKFKNLIDYDISKIKDVKTLNELKSFEKIPLDKVYKMYKKVKKFSKALNQLKKMDIKDEETQKFIIANFSFIFHISKNSSQFENSVYKGMQYAFWQIVIEIGGRYVGFRISADFLQHSLKIKPEDLHITEGFIVDEIKRNEQFNNLIKKVINENKNDFYYNKENNKDIEMFSFRDKDLYFSLHGLIYFSIQATKKQNNWEIEIKLEDEYNFDDPKGFDRFYTDAGSKAKSILSSTLYNFANISEKNGVIKTYHIYIDFMMNKEEENK